VKLEKIYIIKLSIAIKDNLIEDQIKKFRKVLISSKRLRVE